MNRTMQVGDIITLRSFPGKFEVILVNHSRARIKSTVREKVTGFAYNPKTGKKDKPFAFDAPAKEIDIAPTTSVNVVGSTGRKPVAKIMYAGFIVPVGVAQ